MEAGPLAQLAEQQTLNLWVLGSIPRRLTTPHPWRPKLPHCCGAKVAELVDALDLGSSPGRVGGSSPPFRTPDAEPVERYTQNLVPEGFRGSSPPFRTPFARLARSLTRTTGID